MRDEGDLFPNSVDQGNNTKPVTQPTRDGTGFRFWYAILRRRRRRRCGLLRGTNSLLWLDWDKRRTHGTVDMMDLPQGFS